MFLEFIGSEILKNTSVLVSGTVIAQLIPILLQPILRRMYPPEAFGAYTVYLSVIGIIVTITSLKYDLAVVLPKSNKESTNIVGLTMISGFIISFILFLFIIWKFYQIQDFLNIPDQYSFAIYLIPLGLFLLTINQNFNFYLVRQKAFLSSSINKFSRRGSEGISQLSFGYTKTINGLFFSDIIGNFFNSVIAIFQSTRRGFSFKEISIENLKFVAKQYQEYPRYNLIPGLMSASSFLLPAIIINRTYSAEMAGYYDLSKLLLSIPLALISVSLSNVLLQRISEKYLRKESLLSDLKPVLYIVSFIALAEIIVVMFFGTTLFKLFFGKSWGFSGQISKILVWSYALNFTLASFTTILIALRKIKIFSYWQVAYFIVILSLFFITSLPFNKFLYTLVSLEVFCYIVLAIIIVKTTKKYELEVRNLGVLQLDNSKNNP